jgi:glutamyl-tRNA reductase
MEITVTGVNHKRAPVELREKLAVADAALPAALSELQKSLGASEMVILSTCNRVEIYAVHEETPPSLEAVTTLLAARHGLPVTSLAPAFYRHQGADAARHLFRVASGLDSMVLGEPQITAQVKEAYQAAREAGATSRVLNKLFQHALFAAKRVRSSTSIGEKNVSVPSVAAGLAEKIFQDLSTKRLVVLGAGEMGELTTVAFRNRGVSDIRVVSRSIESARALADRIGGQAHTMDGIAGILPLGDIVIACLAAPAAVLGAPEVATALEARRQEPMFLIDLAVPRNVNPEVDRLDNVYLFNVDDLDSIVQQNVLDREKEVARSEPLIEEEARAFLKEFLPTDTKALLVTLRERLQAIADEELRRTLSRLEGLPAAQRDEVVEMNRRLINKILHHPTEQLRAGTLDGEQLTNAELVRKLFDLNN